MNWFRLCLSILLALYLLPAQAQSVTLPDLTGPVILTVTGLDPLEFPGGIVELDLGRMEAIGVDEIETTSIWTDGTHRYTGVMLRDLVEFLGIGAVNLRLHALNDYAVEFPAVQATDAAPILAYQFDGAAMSVRDKGPVWVMYPFDDDADYRTDTNFSRSVWQLDRIDVLP